MSLKLTHDEFDLLKLFLNHQKLSITHVETFLEKSSATSRKKILNLNNFFKLTGIGIIQKINMDNYSLILNDNYLNNLNNLNKSQQLLTSKERINYITFLLIFEKNVILSSLTSLLNVTFGTLNSDLRKLKLFLKKFNLKIQSTPWKGICLKGSSNDIFIFSIKFLTKYFLEQEFNIVSKTIYNLNINPYINDYLSLKLKQFDYSSTNLIFSELIKQFDIEFNLFFKIALKSILIYTYLNNNFKLEINFNKYLKETVRHVS